MSRSPTLEQSSTEGCMDQGFCVADDLEPIAYTDEKHDTDPSLELNGYKFIRKICDTQQGELLEAASLNAHKSKSSPVVIIKKISKALFRQRITKTDAFGMTYCSPNNILKESIILNHLTVNNHCSYMVQFVDLFYSVPDQHYYLVTKQIDGDDAPLNLKQFVEQAQKHICEGKLDVKEYVKVIKWIFWQLSVWLHWMHNDMHCCHLDLKLEHVLLKDAGFIIDPKTETVTAKRSTSIRVCDFGSAELFQNGVFECDKPCSVLRPLQYQSPALIDEVTYDARAADIWALGAMLFESLTGQVLYPDVFGGVDLSLSILCKSTNTNCKTADLVRCMLEEDDSKRIAAVDILKHKWFKAYYSKYEKSIAAKSVSQKAELAEQVMTSFPYYDRTHM
eukprot:431921_1